MTPRARAAVLVFALGCGAAEEPARNSPVAEPDVASEASVRVALVETASPARTVTGVVRFAGRAPLRRPITPIARTAGCIEHDEPPLTEDVVVTDGALRDVVVRLRRAPAGVEVPDPAPADDRTMDQAGCVFVPHVVALRAGARLAVGNSDAVSHNVRLVSDRNPGVNRTIGPGGAAISLELPRPDRARLACDLHPWMSAWVVSVDHPWFDVSGEDGEFVLPELPAGALEELQLVAWHPTLGELASEAFTLAEGVAAEVEFTFVAAPKEGR